MSLHSRTTRAHHLSIIALLTSVVMVGFVLILPRGPSRAQSGVIYVDAAASGANDGTSWTDAYTDLQSALSVASDGDEIWVSTGVYTPGTSESDRFDIPSGVKVYGGFAATETVRSERDWEANPTVLSGDLGGDDAADGGVVTETEHITGTNAHHVVWLDGTVSGTPITESTRLDGVIVTAGQADGVGASDDDGGGLFCDGSGGGTCSPTVANVTFTGNHADALGGGMCSYGNAGTSSPTLTNVTFSGNRAERGGGLACDGRNGGRCSASVAQVTFSDNRAERDGGGMYNTGFQVGVSSPTLTDVTFTGNQAASDGGAMFNDGQDGTSSPSLTNVIFNGNRAEYDGGAVYNFGLRGDSSPTLTDVVFDANEADDGGAMFNVAWEGGTSSPTITDVTFRGNYAADEGGAMVNNGESGVCRPTLTNVAFSGNQAQFGGAMANQGVGGISSPTMTNVTLSGNRATWLGGGMVNYGDGSSDSPILTNVILWGNRTSGLEHQIYNQGSAPTIAHSLVEGAFDGGSWDTDLGADHGGNVDANPSFVRDPDPGDGDWATPDDNDYGDLRLRSDSPAIDAGNSLSVTVATDLAGNARKHDSPWIADSGSGGTPVVDMGAYENQSTCPAGGPVFVDQGVNGGSGEGTGWDEALRRLGVGLTGAASCDVDEIWVAAGVYVPRVHTPGITETDSFRIPAGVAVYGGFAATETVRSERDWDANPTVLSGDLGGDDGTDARGVVTDTERITGTNAYHVVWLDGTSTPITESTRLDGLIITAGQADGGWADNKNDGGGLYCAARGGGTCSPSVAHVTFRGNRAASRGGGMVNDAESGGVSSPSLTDVTFRGNEARYWGGGLYSYASGDGVSSPTLTNVTFSGNEAHRGGGMHTTGSDATSSPTLTNVTFTGNEAGVGGGMRNKAELGGVSSPTLTNVAFGGNQASYGGGMANDSPDGTNSPTLTNVTFSGNHASNGGGIYNYGDGSSGTMTNVILWGNSADAVGNQISNYHATPTMAYSLVEGGWDGSGVVNFDGGSVTDGGGNIAGDPLFERDPVPGPDGTWGTEDDDCGDLRLRWGSPAIDAGSNTAVPTGVATDLAGNPRITDGDGDGQAVVDMGAYEQEVRPAVYLPLVVRNHVVAPDLVVEEVAATPNEIQVVIRNAGNGTVEDDFWVDLYVDPDPIPTMVNQTWPHVSDRGMVWGVTVDLAPGERVTLTVGGPYCRPAESDVAWPLAVGTPIYAQVDSANAGTAYGSVLESHEMTGGAYNNVSGTEVAASASGFDGEPAVEAEGATGTAALPSRPH